MIKKLRIKVSIYILLLIVIFPLVFAQTTFEEKTSLSRIVGDSPSDLFKQLQKEDISINHATFYTPYSTGNNENYIIKNQFGLSLYGNSFDIPESFQAYDFSDVQSSVDSFNNNELFVLETIEGSNFPELMSSYYSGLGLVDTLKTKDVENWQPSFEENNPLFVFDGPYAGIYLPKEETFVSKLAKDSTMIAPASFNSPEFVRSVLCQLEDGKSIGQIYKDARNFHYSGGSKSSSDNFIGLVLQSYMLYGNPRQKISMPNYDSELIKAYCKNYLQNLDSGIEFLGYVGNYSQFRKHLTFKISSYNLVDENNFTFINISNLGQREELGELVLPESIRTTYFSKNTIFTNYSLDSVSDPVNFVIENLPEYDFGFTNRTCYEDMQNYTMLFSQSYDSNNHNFVVTILPVTINNCTTGNITLYREFNYSVDYISLSPAMIKDISSPLVSYGNETVNVTVEIQNLRTNAVNATLAIFDDTNTKLSEKQIYTNQTEFNLLFRPMKNGLNKYSVELIYENETTHYKDFFIETLFLELKLHIPITTPSSIRLNLSFWAYENVKNYADYYLLLNDTILEHGNFSGNQEKWTIGVDYAYLNGLTRANQSYEFQVHYHYLDNKKVETFQLITNNMPLLTINSEPYYYENQTIILNYTIYDADNDTLNIIINDTRFNNISDSFVWQTNYEESGNYSVEVVVSDGLLEKSLILPIEVINRYPPASIYGNIKYSNGSDVHNKTLAAQIDDITIATTQVYNGTYSILVTDDDPETLYLDGANINDTITFIVDESDADQTLLWQPNLTQELNLTINSLGFEIMDLSSISQNGKEVLFEVILANTGLDTINDFNWSFDSGESTIYSKNLFNLSSQKNAILYFYHTYQNIGDYNVTFKGFNEQINITEIYDFTLDIDVAVDSVQLLENTSLNTLFEIEISNNLNQTADNITWAFDTGEDYMDSAMDISLYSMKTGYIYIDYNYSSHGTYETITNVTYGGITDTYYLNITI